MKKEEDINVEILRLTMEIKTTYPEMEKYLEEVPLGIPNDQRMTAESLVEYRDTLKAFIVNSKHGKRSRKKETAK